MLKNSSLCLIVLMGLWGGVGISHLEVDWIAAFFGILLSGLSFFIGLVMGIRFSREEMGKEDVEKEEGGEKAEGELTHEQQKMLIETLSLQKKAIMEASEILTTGVGRGVATKMVDEMFKNKDNLEHLDSVLTRADEIVDEEVKNAYDKITGHRA